MEQAREYWERVDRPNLMIKIPGTLEGVPAIEEMIYEGRNINVTLLFAVEAYEQVAEAYIRGLERRHAEGKGVDVRSVASFFVSRVDTEVDKRLEELGRTDLHGRAGLANARAAYQRFKEIFHGERFAALRGGRRAGAAPAVGVDRREGPRLPRHDVRRRARRARDREHDADGHAAGRRRPRDDQRADRRDGPEPDLRALAEAGIDLDDVTAQLLREGVEKFVEPIEKLLEAIESKREAIFTSRPPIDRGLDPRRARAADRGTRQGGDRGRRRAPHLAEGRRRSGGRPGTPEVADRLGLADGDGPDARGGGRPARRSRPRCATRASPTSCCSAWAARRSRPRSSAAASASRRGLSRACTCSTRPTPARSARSRRRSTSSTRSSSSRPSRAGRSRRSRSSSTSGRAARDGRAFVAITDPGSGVEALAREHDFRRTFLNDPNIGGRYSALSFFGLVPAALMGADIQGLLDRAGVAEQNCLTLRRRATPTAACGSGWRGASSRSPGATS